MNNNFDNQISRLFRASRYAERVLAWHPEWRDWLDSACRQSATITVKQLLSAITADKDIDSALRLARQRTMLAILCRDLNGLADFDEVATAISLFADGVVRIACETHRRALLAEFGAEFGMDELSDLVVVGMGKLGGLELNVSSDIDLIFIHQADGEATADKSWHEFHTQLGKRIIRTLDNVDDHGFVFRVDMRLRPFGSSGPLVSSLATLQDYFVKQARPWERYAWLKARALTGVSANCESLNKLIQPFVYRRYHDYAAIDEMRSLHAQIRAEAAKRGKEDDIKVGRGGIRELEFVAQLNQLIRGGRDARLQTKSTREALSQLAQLSILPATTVEALQTAYLFLRNLEHRLQYLDDQQTQMLPSNDDDRMRIAEAMDFDDWAAFLSQLEHHRAVVTAAFEAAFGGNSGNGGNEGLIPASVSSQNSLKTLACIGLFNLFQADSQPTIEARYNTWQASARMASLSPKIRERLSVLIPRTIDAAAAVDPHHTTLFRLWDLIEAIDKRETYLALLIEYPNALARVALIAHKSAWAADFLRRHPILLDELVNARSTAAALNWSDEKARLQAACDATDGDIERQYEILRHAKQVATLKLNIADIEGRLSVMSLSDELSALADMLLDVTLTLAWRTLNPSDPRDWQPPQGFAILGYGKLGSKELGYASDLDLVFLYDDRIEAGAEKFAKLAQRLASWLNTMTRGGVLYETDLRLRPDGAAGLLVSSLSAFRDYQSHRAWVWEHQALTRARWCAGDTNLIAEFDAIRRDVLATKRDRAVLKNDIITMRDKMRAEKKDKAAALNLKHTRGGIVDVEFIVQYLILAYANEHAEFLNNLGNYALLTRAAALGILDEDLAAKVGKAYLAYRERQHRARTNNESDTWIGLDELAGERRAVVSAWGALLG
jgi:[glutamine synthetase] adenylyltransferase / [glutamine synthetase]-adenylyl-L-tyrosine phosphorylase